MCRHGLQLLIATFALLAFASVCRAVDDSPPIPVEITDESRGDAARLTFLVREKMRSSRTFRVVTADSSRIHLFLNAMPVPTAPGTLACSMIWTYTKPGGTTGLYLTSEMFTIGITGQGKAIDRMLAETEKVFDKFMAVAALTQ
jgi:hypothetical protein